MPSVAEEHPRLAALARKRRRDNDVNPSDLQIQSPLYEKLAAQYTAAAAAAAHAGSNHWNADRGAFCRPVQQQLLQQHQQTTNFFSHDNHLIFQHGDPGLLSQQQHQHHNIDSVPRRIAPLPGAKRQRMFEDEGDSLTSDPSTSPQRQRRHNKMPPTQQSRALQDQTDSDNRPKKPTSVSPCHVCHRRPTKKSDLDSYADCLGCGQRTCYICMRECQGWEKDGRPNSVSGEDQTSDEILSRSFHMNDVDDERQQQQRDQEHDAATRGGQAKQDGWAGGGHRQMICSRCCIEKGSDGDIVCLGCLSGMESM
ncbi:hypothetical protein C8034_v002660 [Colletotrichum sidae]|uniref:Uncharacterized protein n=1 Tax=Colletotrichum sidae TaxID=1347389 RepID=A0A4R8TBJ6_9PEZI|nr:hypothetical protein C8034_v002660 [Colletotrichum sidae]